MRKEIWYNMAIPKGAKVWITYDGLTETKRGAKKSYTVEYDDEDVLATEE